MSSFTGMDIAGVRQLATQMDSSADQIQDLMSRLTSALDGTQWVGNDREQFRNDWTGQHCQQLNHVINGLREAAGNARRNADQQEQASAS